MTAREKFQIGDRVRMTAEAIRRRITDRTPMTGRVVGFGDPRKPWRVRILRDGRKTVVSSHADRWMLDRANYRPDEPDRLLDLERAAVTYGDSIHDDSRAEFTGQAVLEAALTFARSISTAVRERLGR